MDMRIPPPVHGRDLGAELRALHDQLRALSGREVDRLERVLANEDLTEDERTHLTGELARFRQVRDTELD